MILGILILTSIILSLPLYVSKFALFYIVSHEVNIGFYVLLLRHDKQVNEFKTLNTSFPAPNYTTITKCVSKCLHFHASHGKEIYLFSIYSEAAIAALTGLLHQVLSYYCNSISP